MCLLVTDVCVTQALLFVSEPQMHRVPATKTSNIDTTICTHHYISSPSLLSSMQFLRRSPSTYNVPDYVFFVSLLGAAVIPAIS